jgi:uncharacterized protein YegL
VEGIQQSTGKILTMRVEPVPNNMDWINGSPKDRQREAGNEHITVLIVIDVSGSMSGTPMQKAKEAARDFLAKVDLSFFSVGIVAVANEVRTLCPPSQNAKEIGAAINRLDCGVEDVGYGNSAQPFSDALRYFSAVSGAKFMVVLADGVWNDQPHAVREAKRCHAANIGIAALGFGSADRVFLRNIASCDENAMFTDLNKIGESFSTIAQVLTSGGSGRITGQLQQRR